MNNRKVPNAPTAAAGQGERGQLRTNCKVNQIARRALLTIVVGRGDRPCGPAGGEVQNCTYRNENVRRECCKRETSKSLCGPEGVAALVRKSELVPPARVVARFRWWPTGDLDLTDVRPSQWERM